MQDAGFEIHSQVHSSSVGIPGLRVVAVDAPGGKVTMLLTAMTDAEGMFAFHVSVADATAFFRFARPGDMWNDTKDLHLSVYNGTVLLDTFVQQVSLADFARGQLPSPLEVVLTGTAVEHFEVSGRVLDVDGRPQAGMNVTARRVSVGGLDVLGTDTTDSNGAFAISYDALDVSTPTETKLDLQLVVFDESVEIGRSGIVFGPAPSHRLDVVVGGTYQGRSEFERIAQTLAPFLGTTAPEDVAPHEIELLAQKADLYPPYLAMYVQAARLAEGRDVTAQVFYALLRAQLPADLPRLLATRPAQLRGALEAAHARRILTAPAVGTVEDAIDTAMEDLRTLIVSAAMVMPSGDEPNVRALLDTSGLPETDLEKLYGLWVAHDGSDTEFWETVSGDSEIGDSAGVLHFTTEAAALTRGYLPALEGIQALRVATTISTVSDLTAWDASEWVTFLTPLGAPDDLPGADETARVQFFAEAMTRIIEERYPTQVLARRLERDEPAGSAGVVEFLDANPSFDIRSTVIPMYLDANPGAMPGGVDPEETEANLKAVQRLWSLTPTHNHYDVATVLIAGGLRSATEIARMGQAAFVDAYAAALEGTHPVYDGPTLARSIHAKATMKSASAVTSAIAYLPAFNSTPIGAIEAPSDPLAGDGAATLTDLFGSIDYCGCKHCRSVLSPAAYLVDLLALLQNSTVGASHPLETLTARRPDLVNIELSCINTNTVMPYIDLVNELLEQAVAEASPPYALTANQTTWSANDLRLFPEHRDYNAYAAPASAIYPWSLPMDLPTVELRAYLERLGVSREELMRTFQVGAPPADGVIAAEVLGMMAYELGAFDGAIGDGGIEDGLRVDDAWNLDTDPTFATTLAGDLAQLLATAGLQFDELLDLFTLRSVVNSGTVTLSYAGDEPSCDLADIALVGFTAAIADRMHRFLRLARHAGLAWPDLDVALRALGGTVAVADLAFITTLGDLLRLRKRSRVDIDTLSTLWGASIDTRGFRGQPSLYERLFLSKQVTPGAWGAFVLDSNLDELVAPLGSLAEPHYATIRAGLGISDDDLRRLLESVLEPDPQLDLATLSALFRHVALARIVGLRIDELLPVLTWSTFDPFASPANTLAFMDLVAEIGASGMSVAELDYLLRHVYDPATGIHPSDASIAAAIDGILAAIAELDAELVAGVDDGTKTLAHLTALGVAEADIQEWLRILAWGEDEATDALLAEDETILTALLTGLGIEMGVVTTFITDINANLDAEAPTYPTANALLVQLRRQAGIDALVAQHLASATGLAPEAAAMLANDTELLAVGTSSIQDVLVVSPSSELHTEAIVRMNKAAMVIKGLGVRTADLSWYFGDEAQAQTMDLTVLPIVPDTPSPLPSAHFVGWRRVRLGQELQASFSTADNAIRLALEAGEEEEELQVALDALVASSDWDALDVAYVAGSSVLDLTLDDLRNPTNVAKIRNIIDLVRRTGVRAQDLHGWATTAPSEASAVAARRALKARHSEESWAAAIRPMMDRIREEQRDALVAVLLGRGDFADEIELYGHLLVDPEMNACMLTSRIKLAISSVQLFIQRSLMAMESTIDLPEPVSKLWVTFKNYRVWEASRKVFFYPENWIEPELRDDKTPFFRELESQIDQGPLDDERVERAFADYLSKLHEVAHLDVVALYDDKARQVVHVIGRTRSDPRKHFYRARIQDLYWTPWEAVDLEITSDHVLVQVLNRRLFLFWLELTEEREPAKEGSDEPGPASYRIQIAWSERREGEWTPRRQSRVAAKTATDGKEIQLKYHFLTAAGRDIFVLYDQGGSDDNAVVTVFRYDNCLDQLNEIGPSIEYLSDYEVGKYYASYRKLAQQYHHKDVNDDPSIKLTLLWKQELSWYWPLALCDAAGPHRVTITRQDLQHLGIRPATFDNGSHALYIVPTWYGEHIEPARSAPGEVPPTTGWNALGLKHTESTAPGPIPPSSPFAKLDEVATAAPWSGVVPGMHMVLLDDDTLATPNTKHSPSTTKLLDGAQGMAGGDVELGFAVGTDGGGAVPGGGEEIITLGYRLDPFHHPFTCELRGELNLHGVEGVLASEVEGLRRQSRVVVDFVPPGETGDGPHKLTHIVQPPYPVDDFDFTPGGAYSVYNWELFFHVPLYIAERLRKEQRFEEAMRWYHFVFNPLAKKSTPTEGSERFWNIKPFYEEAADGMPDIIKQVFSDEGLDVDPKVAYGFWTSALIWLADPFNPHAIARWRPGTYRWAVVQKYLDNLIEWADSLFRRDTIETINEATQLYLLAAAILGQRPKRLPAVDPPVHTYDELTTQGLFGGLVALEDFVPTPAGPGLDFELGAPVEPPPTPVWWYFCVPANDQLLAYWDTVGDRLYKIRNCQNIDGVKRQLALFEPPIDPSLLVRARALGLDLAAVIADLQAPLPHYRYRTLAARASELVGDVRAFGGALQQALERKDAEALQELRVGHEVSLLAAVRKVREQQVAEAKENITTLERYRTMVLQRRSYYLGKEKLSDREERHIADLKRSTRLTVASQATRLASGIISTVYPTSFVGTQYQQVVGGQVWSSGLNAISDGLAMGATIAGNRANISQIRAGYDRRFEDWSFQAQQAGTELTHIAQQILTAEVRLDIARKELDNHDKQAEQAQTVETFLRTRYSSQELYTWLMGQLSALYYQSYQLAYDMAKKAERALQYELCTDDGFVGYGHWDSLHKGLFAGERLQLDLRRMEAAYLDRDRRHYELTKRVSLRQVDPAALLELRRTGTCDFDVTEVLFDLDHPGHYRRRIKAVSVTIPAVVGPHTTLGAKLTLLEDRTRLEPTLTDPDAVRVGYGGISSIATSHARGDSGLFTLDFRDERLLPFEGAGAWSRWRLELPSKVRQLDYDTITDVELQIQYTALDGGSPFRSAVEGALEGALNDALGDGELALMLSAKAAFPVAWERFLYPAEGEESDPLSIPIVLERLPYLLRGLAPKVTHVSLTFVLDADAVGDVITIDAEEPTLTDPSTSSTSVPLTFTSDPASPPPASMTASVDYDPPAEPPPDPDLSPVAITDEGWTLERNDLAIPQPERVKDLIVVVRFNVTVPGGS